MPEMKKRFYLLTSVILIVLLLLISVAFISAKPSNQQSQQIQSSVITTNYVYGPNGLTAKIKDGEINYAVNDRLGSTRAFVDSDGEKVAEFKSLPFGQEVVNEGDDEIRYSFTGKEKDDTGLHYFAARYYDSNIGRFTTTDPVAGNHPYVYVGNDPMNMIDPSGMEGALIQIARDDPNGAFSSEGFLQLIDQIKGSYDNVQIDIISTQGDYSSSIEDFYNDHGQIDYFFSAGHGVTSLGGSDHSEVHLGSNYLTIDFFKENDFSDYFSDSAKGVRFSCHAANNCGEETNLAQAEANALGIPLQSFIEDAISSAYKFYSNLELCFIHTISERVRGFDSKGFGLFYSSVYGNNLNVLLYEGESYVYTRPGGRWKGVFYSEDINSPFVLFDMENPVEINNKKYSLAPIPLEYVSSIYHSVDVPDTTDYNQKILITRYPE